jgi:hypothetical protein
MTDNLYGAMTAIVGFIAFLIIWAVSIYTYGFLGFLLGWLPAMIVAGIIGVLWPLILLVKGFLAFALFA